MALFLYQCQNCGLVNEARFPTGHPASFTLCQACGFTTKRLYTAPVISVHQTGAEWLNEVASGRGDPPSGMSREEGMRAAQAKARSDKGMKGQSSKTLPTISTASHSATLPYSG